MNTILIDVLTTLTDSNHPNKHASVFKTLQLSTNDINGMFISDRQDALNLRHRSSEPGYASDWHVAGDPTLIIIRQGALTLELKNGARRTYHAGDQFIAADYLVNNKTENTVDSHALATNQGHKAFVEGDKSLLAVHIKLSNQPAKWYKKVVNANPTTP